MATTDHAIADRAAPRIRRRFLQSVDRAARNLDRRTVTEALQTGNPIVVLARIPWREIEHTLTIELAEELLATLNRAAVAAIERVPARRVAKADEEDLAAAGFRFDATNPESVQWARQEAAMLVQQVSQETRLAIRRIIARLFEDQIPPFQAVNLLLPHVGLTERMALSVDTFRRDLMQRGVSSEQVVQLVSRYAERYRKWRALNIARTESIRATSRGQLTLWEQMQAQGFLDAEDTRRRWVVTRDDRLCPICAPMPQQLVTLTQPFRTGDGNLVPHPPAHPQCRCAVVLVFRNPDGSFPPPPQPAAGNPSPRRQQRLKPKVIT